MSPSNLRDFLKATAGDEEIEFVIPHLFLPPRYLKDSNRRNLVAILDRDLTIHLRWENARMSPWANITKGEFKRLVSDALRRMMQYQPELKIFGDFVNEVAEAPFEDPMYDEPIPSVDVVEKASREEEDIPVVVARIKRTPTYAVGGESPLPDME